MSLTLLPMSALAADEATTPALNAAPTFANAVRTEAVGNYKKMTEVNNWYDVSYKAKVSKFVGVDSAFANVKTELKKAIGTDETIYLVSTDKKDSAGNYVSYLGKLSEGSTYLFSGVASGDTYELKVRRGQKEAIASHKIVLETAPAASVLQSENGVEVRKTGALYYAQMKRLTDKDSKPYYQTDFVFADKETKTADLKVALSEAYRDSEFVLVRDGNIANGANIISGETTPYYGTYASFSKIVVPGQYVLMVKEGGYYTETIDRFFFVDNSDYALRLNQSYEPAKDKPVELVAGHLYDLVSFGKYPPKSLSVQYNGGTPSFIKLLGESGKVVAHNVSGGAKTVTFTAVFENAAGQKINRSLDVLVNVSSPVTAPIQQTVTVNQAKSVFTIDLPTSLEGDYATYRLVKATSNNANVVLSDDGKSVTAKKELLGVDVGFTFYFEDEAYPTNKFSSSHTVNITAKPANASYYLITATAGEHGTVSPKAAKMEGGYFETQKISIIPEDGYKVQDVLVGTDPTKLSSVGAVTEYTFRNVKSDNYLHATFVKDETQVYYTISASAGANGKVSPESVRVKGLSTQKIVITPDTGYKVKDVKVDGSSVGAVTEYTFNKIDANHSLVATFTEAEGYYSITAGATAGGKVSPEHVRVKKLAIQKITITPYDGYQIKDVTVDGRSVGAVKDYTFTAITADHTLIATFTRIKPFTDVPVNAWYYDEVMYVADHGIMTGTTTDTFDPNGTASRGMLVTTLYRMAGEPSVSLSSVSFTDVSSGSWYEKSVKWAASNKIVDGYGNGKFGPNDPVTREQFVTILYRYASLMGYNTYAGSGINLNVYKDAGSVSGYAVTAMQWGVGGKLIEGKSGLLLDPQGKATRAEMATMLMRFDKNFVG